MPSLNAMETMATTAIEMCAYLIPLAEEGWGEGL